MSWQHVKVGDLITQVRGVSYSSGDAIDELKDGYVELLRANNIADGHLTFDDVTYVPKSKVTEKQYLKQNDIVIAASSGSISVVGKAASFNVNRAATFGAFCKVLRPNANVDARYIANYFQTGTYRRTVSALAEGANINNLRNEHIDNLDILLPPLAHQQRIAAILDKAAEIKAKREQAIAKLDELAQSTFVEMFGDDACVIKTLNELGAIKTGATPPTSKENMFGTQIPFVTPGDLGSGLQAKRFLTIEGAKESVTVRTGAALVCCIGATIGKMDIAKEISAFNQQINAIEWSDKIDDVYGLYALKSIKGQVISNATSTTLPILKKSLFQQLKIKVPLKAKQLEFAARVKQASQCIAEQKQSLKKIDALCLSLQHQAFTTGFNA